MDDADRTPPQELAVAAPAAGLDLPAAELKMLVAGLAADWLAGRRTAGFRRLGEGLSQIEEGFAAIEPTVRHGVCSMQPRMGYEPHSRAVELDEQSRRRGLEMRYVTTERSLALYPLITSEMPHVHFGPVPCQLMVIDGRTVVVAGPLSETGQPTAWLATRADLLERSRAIFEATWSRSRPGVPEGMDPPFTPRQCEVARRVVLGVKDSGIARELGISVRTVAADVAQLMQGVGATSRAELAMVLLGGTDLPRSPRPRPRTDGAGRG
ncbi:helix-turn-helix transcriptional regulator [Intrasporangium sp. YIM S08009]|uniref:helix-turn-helix transcriptional regulator n=1 Tax=Intrasporangium zincisolvens TaxID=3080018 RepID=UPI002B05BEE2|nr:helix-turn-helix transcriptional regulator [Intrasporangium sp. YIM S08009]